MAMVAAEDNVPRETQPSLSWGSNLGFPAAIVGSGEAETLRPEQRAPVTSVAPMRAGRTYRVLYVVHRRAHLHLSIEKLPLPRPERNCLRDGRSLGGPHHAGQIDRELTLVILLGRVARV
jgi:hypothetical protein